MIQLHLNTKCLFGLLVAERPTLLSYPIPQILPPPTIHRRSKAFNLSAFDDPAKYY